MAGILDDAKRLARERARKEIRDAVAPWIAVSILLSVVALARTRR